MTKHIVNLNTLEGLTLITFPDNQPHVRLDNINDGDVVDVICSITSPAKLLQLLMVADAIVGVNAKARELFIPYLMAARYDRRMLHGDSYDLQIVATLINQCNFFNVTLLDVHSPVALRYIQRSNNLLPNLVNKHWKRASKNFIYICPDKGAINRVPTDVSDGQIIYCEKQRDLSNGKINLVVNNPQLAEGQRCVIVDDICDGGRTFIEIAKQLQNVASLSLVVTHGIFSNGFYELNKYFDEIITTNSLPQNDELKNKNTTIYNIY